VIRIRPIQLGDLERLMTLAEESGPGMTNLPADRGVLERRIRASTESFAAEPDSPGDETYLLAAEDTARGQIVGTSAIIGSVGLTRPFYSYKILSLSHTSLELQKYDTVQVLQMVNEYRGATEIGTLYLTPAYRRDRNGRLLSLSRFLYMAEFPQRFSDLVMAEMRGVHDERGRTVFWDSLGQHFFAMDFNRADYLSSMGHYQFIADLMPAFPIYIRLLPREAQQVIGVPHQDTRPALELLTREGFRFEGLVDVFDAGPTVHAPLSHLRTVAASRRAAVAAVDEAVRGPTCMVANVRSERFAVCRGPVAEAGDGDVRLTPEVAEALGVGAGDAVRYAPL